MFRCDRKTAIERDHAVTVSDQTKFKVAESRSEVAVRCDWGITPDSSVIESTEECNFRYMALRNKHRNANDRDRVSGADTYYIAEYNASSALYQ